LYDTLTSDTPKVPIQVKMSTRELVSALSNLPKFRNTNIVCTLGANGVLVFMPRFHRPKTVNETPSFMYFPAARLVGSVKDTTGAGDTFAGYFVRGIMGFGPGAEVGTQIGERDVMAVLKVCVQVSRTCFLV
jgi:ribokinase